MQTTILYYELSKIEKFKEVKKKKKQPYKSKVIRYQDRLAVELLERGWL